MESSGSGGGGGGSGSVISRRYGLRFSVSNYIQARLTSLLEYSGVLRRQVSEEVERETGTDVSGRQEDHAVQSSADGEVSISIIGGAYQESVRGELGSGSRPLPSMVVGTVGDGNGGGADSTALSYTSSVSLGGNEGNGELDREVSSSSIPPSALASGAPGREEEGNVTTSARDASHQRYDIQQVAKWIEQILPFSLLLLVVFIRQHVQGFFVSIWIAAVLFKSNDVLRKQTALKGERKKTVLFGIILVSATHVFGVYWWYKNTDLIFPLVLIPPKEIPLFWHAIFIILVNDIMVRHAAMVVKCVLLIYYKNRVGRNYKKQGQLLTVVEYLLLFYRALLPAPVWYRFFLNQEYGSLFSSLITGLYLTFKLTSVVEKVQLFITAVKALSIKEVHYGSHASVEQVIAAGDLCAICQEKIQAPILLRCKHIFCEDCVSEWFEREVTCPLCRALVKQADLRSFSDGSTSLLFQLF